MSTRGDLPNFGVYLRAYRLRYRWWHNARLFIRVRPVWPSSEKAKPVDLRQYDTVQSWLIELAAPALHNLVDLKSKHFVLIDDVDYLMRHVRWIVPATETDKEINRWGIVEKAQSRGKMLLKIDDAGNIVEEYEQDPDPR